MPKYIHNFRQYAYFLIHDFVLANMRFFGSLLTFLGNYVNYLLKFFFPLYPSCESYGGNSSAPNTRGDKAKVKCPCAWPSFELSNSYVTTRTPLAHMRMVTYLLNLLGSLNIFRYLNMRFFLWFYWQYLML